MCVRAFTQCVTTTFCWRYKGQTTGSGGTPGHVDGCGSNVLDFQLIRIQTNFKQKEKTKYMNLKNYKLRHGINPCNLCICSWYRPFCKKRAAYYACAYQYMRINNHLISLSMTVGLVFSHLFMWQRIPVQNKPISPESLLGPRVTSLTPLAGLFSTQHSLGASGDTLMFQRLVYRVSGSLCALTQTRTMHTLMYYANPLPLSGGSSKQSVTQNTDSQSQRHGEFFIPWPLIHSDVSRLYTDSESQDLAHLPTMNICLWPLDPFIQSRSPVPTSSTTPLSQNIPWATVLL